MKECYGHRIESYDKCETCEEIEQEEMKECYGHRIESYDKCETCEEIEQCSVMTLELIFKDKIIIVV